MEQQRRNRFGLHPSAVSAISGAVAGALTTTICSPLDVVKTRMQVQDAIVRPDQRGKPMGMMSFLANIYREEGPRGWFRGYSSAMLTVPFFWAVYFPCYTAAKDFMLPRCKPEHKPLVHMSAAICGGLITDIATNPLWVVRTRLISQHLHVKYRGEQKQYTGTFQTMRLVVQQEGVRGLYKGLTASFLGLSHVAVQFPLYEALKELINTSAEASSTSGGGSNGATAAAGNTWSVLLASTTSKLVASSLTCKHERKLPRKTIAVPSRPTTTARSPRETSDSSLAFPDPHEVIRARLQDQRKSNGAF